MTQMQIIEAIAVYSLNLAENIFLNHVTVAIFEHDQEKWGVLFEEELLRKVTNNKYVLTTRKGYLFS